jgi:SAM-dependent MidA family methyltransferase
MNEWIQQEQAQCAQIGLHPLPEDLQHAYEATLSITSPLPFDAFMQHALYHPAHGYYQTAHYGQRGDFTTAPESSAIFGQAIAEYLIPYFKAHPDHLFVEIGPGSGALAKSMMTYWMNHLDHPPPYLLVEQSMAQQMRQKDRLKNLPGFRWTQSLDTPISGVILANEVIDALAASRSIYQNGIWYDLGVTQTHGVLSWIKMPAKIVPDVSPKSDYIFEHRPHLTSWLQSNIRHLQEGMMLFFDYGYEATTYYHPERKNGTLTCFYHHMHHSDPLRLVGRQDISVHANFSELYQAMIASDLSLFGYCTQGDFLRAQPLDQLIELNERHQHAQAIKMLMMPHEMGELVKVMSAGKNVDPIFGEMPKDLSGRL